MRVGPPVIIPAIGDPGPRKMSPVYSESSAVPDSFSMPAAGADHAGLLILMNVGVTFSYNRVTACHP